MIEHLRRSILPFVTGVAAGAAGLLIFSGEFEKRSPNAMPPSPAAPLLAASETVIGEPLIYPSAGRAKVTAAVVTLAPGQETGWHTHGSPVVGYVLEGTLDVDYGDKGVRTYRVGDAMLEAIGFTHNGRNAGAGPMRILAVFIGAEGMATSAPAAAPDRNGGGTVPAVGPDQILYAHERGRRRSDSSETLWRSTPDEGNPRLLPIRMTQHN